MNVSSLLLTPYPCERSSHNHIAESVPFPTIKICSVPLPDVAFVKRILDITSDLKLLVK